MEIEQIKERKGKVIHVVTSGEYSDYGINAMFSTKERAQNYIDAYTHKDSWTNFNDIEEWELDAPDNMVRKGYKAYRVHMAMNGDMISCDLDNSPYSSNGGVNVYQQTKSFGIDCFARSQKHALKIANEKRRELIAQNVFVTANKRKQLK